MSGLTPVRNTDTIYGMLASMGKFDKDPIELDIDSFSKKELDKAKSLPSQHQRIYLNRVKGFKERLEREYQELKASNESSEYIRERITHLTSTYSSSLTKHYQYLLYYKNDVQSADAQTKEVGQKIKQAQVNFPIYTLFKRQSAPIRLDAEKRIDEVAKQWLLQEHCLVSEIDREKYAAEVRVRINDLYMEVEHYTEQKYTAELSDQLIQNRIQEYNSKLNVHNFVRRNKESQEHTEIREDGF